ncbi:MAG TPA: hypothetical protein VHM28_00290, partial [Anaerolineales bacterium]|nr:hypothetical protein [Anaerolineales bacterium]
MKKIRNIVIGIVTLAILGYFGAGYVIWDRLTKVPAPKAEQAQNTPANFKMTYKEYAGFDTFPYFVSSYDTVTFPSRQAGINLSGWYMEVDPAAPVIIVTHGKDASKRAENVLVPAGMLAHNGFNVLMYDFRNHGESDHDNDRYGVGNKEYLDVLGAWDWLV